MSVVNPPFWAKLQYSYNSFYNRVCTGGAYIIKEPTLCKGVMYIIKLAMVYKEVMYVISS